MANHRSACYIIASLPLVFYSTTEFLTYQLNNPLVDGLTPTYNSLTGYYENANRYTLQAAFVMYFWLVVAALCLLLKEVLSDVGLKLFSIDTTDQKTSQNRYHAWEDIIFFLFLVGITIGVAIYSGSVAGENRNYQNLGAELFASVLNHCHEALGQINPEKPDVQCTFGDYTKGQPPSGFFKYLDWITYLAATGVAACSLGCARAVLVEDSDLKSWPRSRVFRLPNLFLYVGSVIFSGAMLCVYSWSGWPTPFLQIPEEKEAYRSLQNAIALFWGSSFSLVVLSFYLPTVLYLNHRISGIANAESAKIADDSVPIQTAKILEKSLAILAPIVTALISAAAASLIDGL